MSVAPCWFGGDRAGSSRAGRRAAPLRVGRAVAGPQRLGADAGEDQLRHEGLEHGPNGLPSAGRRNRRPPAPRGWCRARSCRPGSPAGPGVRRSRRVRYRSVTASRPPGRSTRRHSASVSGRVADQRERALGENAVERSVGEGQAAGIARDHRQMPVRCGGPARDACATRSRPSAAQPCWCSSFVATPTPQPRSSTRSPGAKPAQCMARSVSSLPPGRRARRRRGGRPGRDVRARRCVTCPPAPARPAASCRAPAPPRHRRSRSRGSAAARPGRSCPGSWP